MRLKVDGEAEEQVEAEARSDIDAGVALLGPEVLSLPCRSPQKAKAGFFLTAWLTGSSMTAAHRIVPDGQTDGRTERGSYAKYVWCVSERDRAIKLVGCDVKGHSDAKDGRAARRMS